MEGSIGAGVLSSCWGMLREEGSTRSLLWGTAVLVLESLLAGVRGRWWIFMFFNSDLQVDVTLGGLAGDELLPGLGALTDNVHGVLLVLALAGEGELVLGLSVGDFVDAEPLVGGAEKAGEVTLDVLDVVEAGSERVVDVDDDDLPVGLALVEESHDTEDLDLLDLTGLGDELADLADVERVVVAVHLGLGVGDVGVLPGLGEGTVVPEVALVGEAVADETQLALLGVLLDGVQGLILGDLRDCWSARGLEDGGPLAPCCLIASWLNGLSCPFYGYCNCATLTSCLALVQRGISTTMFKTVCCSLA